MDRNKFMYMYNRTTFYNNHQGNSQYIIKAQYQDSTAKTNMERRSRQYIP